MIPFAGCTFCHYIMKKTFLNKESSRCKKTPRLDPLRKQSFSHKKDMCALVRYVVGPGGANTIKMARFLWVRDTEWFLEPEKTV